MRIIVTLTLSVFFVLSATAREIARQLTGEPTEAKVQVEWNAAYTNLETDSEILRNQWAYNTNELAVAEFQFEPDTADTAMALNAINISYYDKKGNRSLFPGVPPITCLATDDFLLAAPSNKRFYVFIGVTSVTVDTQGSSDTTVATSRYTGNLWFARPKKGVLSFEGHATVLNGEVITVTSYGQVVSVTGYDEPFDRMNIRVFPDKVIVNGVTRNYQNNVPSDPSCWCEVYASNLNKKIRLMPSYPTPSNGWCQYRTENNTLPQPFTFFEKVVTNSDTNVTTLTVIVYKN